MVHLVVLGHRKAPKWFQWRARSSLRVELNPEAGRRTNGGCISVEQMNVLIHCYMDRSSALLEGEVYYIEVSVVRKGVTQQAAQGCTRQQQPIGGLDILYLNTS